MTTFMSSSRYDDERSTNYRRRSRETAILGGRKKKKHNILKRSGINRFRALARTVINNLPWIANPTSDIGESPEVNAYILTHKKTHQLLTIEDKLVFLKPKEKRTDQEIGIMIEKLGLFKAFRNYPQETKTEILRRAHYKSFKKGRVVVKQGSLAENVYFIVEGEVKIEMVNPDPLFQDEMIHEEEIETEGDVFAEVSLLYDEPQVGTVTVKSEYVEMIVLEKDDFDQILKTTLTKNWNQVRWALKKFPYFNDFPESAIRAICGYAYIIHYRPKMIIEMKELSSGSDLVTFIIDGTCKVIQSIKLVENKNCKQVEGRYRLCINPDKKGNQKITEIFMQTCTLQPRSLIGLPDRMSQHLVMTDSPVLALVMPLYGLLRFNYAHIWERVINTIDLVYPTEEYIYDRFIQLKKFQEFRKAISKSFYSTKRKKLVSIHECPLTARALNLKMRPKLYNRIVNMPEHKFGEFDVDDLLEMMKESRENMKYKFDIRMKQHIKEQNTNMQNPRQYSRLMSDRTDTLSKFSK